MSGAQASAHGSPIEVAGVVVGGGPADDQSHLVVHWAAPQRRVAPGQSVVLYEGDTVLGGGTVTR